MENENILGNNLNNIESIKTDIILKDYIPLHKGNYNILAGNGGTGKSLVALKMLVHFLRSNPNEKAVAIFTEDSKATINERLDFIVRGLNITKDEVLERTFFKTLDNHDGEVFAMKINKQNMLNENYFKKFIVNSKLHNIGFVVLDPFEAFHSGLNENDAEDMKFFTTEALQKLGVLTGACILALHHTNKGNVAGARGSSVITNKGRVAYNIRQIFTTNKELGVEQIKEGWEKSVLLSTIKDNHFISRWCDCIANNHGKLDLPVDRGFYNVEEPTVTIYGGLE